MKITWTNVILGAGLLIALLFYFDGCGKIRTLNGDKNKLLESLTGKDNEIVKIQDNIAEQSQFILELSNKQSRLLVDNEELRKEIKAVQAKVVVITETKYDSIPIKVDSAQIIKNYISSKTDSTKDSIAYSLRLPYKENYDSDWISFSQLIDTSGVNTYYGITTRDSLSILLYRQKKKWHQVFSPAEYKVRTESANPYSNIQGIDNIIVKPERKIYEKPWFWGSVGVIVGFIASNKIAR